MSTMNTKKIFAAKIAIIRNGLSYRDFSKSIKRKTGKYISHSTLHEYENGIIPRAENLDALAQYANVKPSWFFDDESDILKVSEECGNYRYNAPNPMLLDLFKEIENDLDEKEQLFLKTIIEQLKMMKGKKDEQSVSGE